MTDPATLLTPEGTPFTTGAARFHDSPSPGDVRTDPRIFVRIEPAGLGFETTAMVDTGAPWCILKPRLGKIVRDHVEALSGEVSIDTRLGRFSGRLYLGTARLVADEGEALDVPTTYFLAPDWPGGNFVGYLGFLARIRFAFEAENNKVYFGP